MTAGADLPHYVKVEAFAYSGDVDFEPTVKFTCPWLYGECHFFPDCSCESWGADHLHEYGPGHEKHHHDFCWMDQWLESAGAMYIGPDADDMHDSGLPRGMNREGQVTVVWMDEWLEWYFTEDAALVA